ncbi:Uncharacterized protein FWK35_00016710 [Aphis craccivora]|uniref:Transposable element P transposase-like RNase H domain-containing protein n=1 Tax=Aphis craccivora TaxID=307492 RepID=A0A6G0XIG3_APHCR|nr:Uncharacterized protein FWK35_00016710 [Aphis craccivora]
MPSIRTTHKKLYIKFSFVNGEYKKRLSISTKTYVGTTLTPARHKIIKGIIKKSKNVKKSNKRFKLKIYQLHCTLIHKKQVQEIVNASKVTNLKNRRYSENWILLCMLLKIRSPSTYGFLREQGILPLPCPRTIRKYLSLLDISCGFDKNLFQLTEQKHEMLVYDEMFLRESFSVNSKKLTYSGLEDFEEESESSGLNANHALVFMFQSLALNFTQQLLFLHPEDQKHVVTLSSPLIFYKVQF